MPEYVCAVAKTHKRLYGLPQSTPPVCCGKPMVLAQGSLQPTIAAQPATAATKPQALGAPKTSMIPEKENKWWQLWK
jgi:hypothetical protein